MWVQRVLKETTKIYNLDKTIAEYNANLIGFQESRTDYIDKRIRSQNYRMRWDIRSLVKCLCSTK